MYWKLILDPSHTYAAEHGCIRSAYAQDFRDEPGGLTGTFRCPATGVVMLEPSFQKRNFATDFKSLDNWRQHTSNIQKFRAASRSMDAVSMFTSLRPAGEQFYFDDLLSVTAGIAIVNANTTFFDNLQWALESTFSLGIDEAFAIHYRGLTDELLRKNNWLYVQWDNIGIHFSHQGHVRVYHYPDRGHIEDTPTLVHEFDIAQAGDLLGKSGMFVFLPIPGHGLVMYHLLSAASFGTLTTNARNYTRKSAHVIPWTTRQVGDYTRLFESSVVRLGMNPYHANMIGFQSTTFELSGTYLGSILNPGYRPSIDPSDVSPGILPTFGSRFGTASAVLRKQDNSGDWVAGTDRQGCVLTTLTTSDSRYTPFMYGWGVTWEPVTLTRDPGEVEITSGYEDVLQRLEFTDDSEGHFEGSVRFKAQTKEACVIVERGEATFEVQHSEDNVEWTTLNGGILKLTKAKMMYNEAWGFFWQCEATLHGQEERFEEVPCAIGTAFDGRFIGENVNTVLTTTGFEAIDEDDMPAAFTNIRVPPLDSGTNFRFHPRPGDRPKQILRALLFMARTQNKEFKMVYDWPNGVWTVVERPRNEENDEWTLTYDVEEEDFDDRIAYYDQPLEFEFLPVEATYFTVVGVAERSDLAGHNFAQVYESTPISNDRAVEDPEIEPGLPNPDYTGRVKGVRFLAPGVGSIDDANNIARKINPRFFHRNVRATVMLSPGHFTLDLKPDVKVILTLPPYRNESEDRTFDLWIKTRTVVIEEDEHGPTEGQANERIILQCDEIWENPIRGE